MEMNRLNIVSAITLACLLVAVPFEQVLADCSDRRAPGMDWSGCKKINKMLGDSNYTGSRFDEAILVLSQLDESNFTNASLVKANLTRSDATGSRFDNADLTKAVGYRANFDKVVLRKSVLTKSEFSRATFRQADIGDVDWTKSELGRVDFSGARLARVDFNYSNLSRAVFTDAELSAVNFADAYTFLTRFEGVDLTDVIGLTQMQLDHSCGDTTTILPQGLSIPQTWPCTE